MHIAHLNVLYPQQITGMISYLLPNISGLVLIYHSKFKENDKTFNL